MRTALYLFPEMDEKSTKLGLCDLASSWGQGYFLITLEATQIGDVIKTCGTLNHGMTSFKFLATPLSTYTKYCEHIVHNWTCNLFIVKLVTLHWPIRRQNLLQLIIYCQNSPSTIHPFSLCSPPFLHYSLSLPLSLLLSLPLSLPLSPLLSPLLFLLLSLQVITTLASISHMLHLRMPHRLTSQVLVIVLPLQNTDYTLSFV